MSALPIPQPELAPFESPSIGRSRTWYPVALELEYKLWYRRKAVRCGRGKTLMMSSCFVEFEADVSLTAGKTITIDMRWPCLLDGECALKLRVFGRVVRSCGKMNFVQFVRYEFRTVGLKSLREGATSSLGSSGFLRTNPNQHNELSLKGLQALAKYY